MNALLSELRAEGLTLYREGEHLRYKGPRRLVTPALVQKLTDHKAELLGALAEELLSLGPPSDPEAREEFEQLSPEERSVFFGCRAVLLEEGAELPQAERDAVAAVLQHRRLSRPRRRNYP